MFVSSVLYRVWARSVFVSSVMYRVGENYICEHCYVHKYYKSFKIILYPPVLRQTPKTKSIKTKQNTLPQDVTRWISNTNQLTLFTHFYVSTQSLVMAHQSRNF